MTSAFRAVIAFAVLNAVLQVTAPRACAQLSDNGATANVVQPAANDINKPVEAVATFMETWQDGNTTVTALRGGDNLHGHGTQGLAGIRQGELQMLGESLVIVDTVALNGHDHDVQVYAEGRVRFQSYGHHRSMESHSIRLRSLSAVDIRATHRSQENLTRPSHLMRQAMDRLDPSRSSAVSPVSLQIDADTFTPPQFLPVPGETTRPSRRIQIRSRSSQQLRFESFQSRDTVPEEQVYIITGGVNVLVEGVQSEFGGRLLQPGVLDLSADRVVVWTQPNGAQGLELNQTLEQPSSARFQVYLEGNILVRQDQNTITASHAFVDVSNDRALLMNADLRFNVPRTGGQVRVRAEKLRQLSVNRFHAQNAWTTTSPYGKPSYRVQASDIFVEPGPISPFTPLDPMTGQPTDGPPLWVTALNSQFLIGDVPVLRLPRITAPAEDPNIPIRQAVVKNDRIFGWQVKTVWDLTKVLGQPKQEGMRWDLLADFLSKRGPAVGIEGQYDLRNNYGRVVGNSSMIYQYDDGVDNLGLDRRAVSPDDYHRGQFIWQHRQELPGQAMLFGEIGLLSDRNYRESFYEVEYDTGKDVETLLGARQDLGVWSGSLLGRVHVNDFEASTDWLPKPICMGSRNQCLTVWRTGALTQVSAMHRWHQAILRPTQELTRLRRWGIPISRMPAVWLP